MLVLVSDQDFNDRILRGRLRRLPELDCIRAFDVGISRLKDPELLAGAAARGRVILTQDRKTMPRYAYERAGQNMPMPGVIVVSRKYPIGKAIDDLEVLVRCSAEGELEGRVVSIPL